MFESTSPLTCPVCCEALQKSDRSYLCPNGHSFDISAQGYVNLLLANQMNSHEPGDDKNMVNARFHFLSKGYYAPLCDALQAICLQYSSDNPTVLDSGCGEGYYTNGVLTALQSADKNPQVIGIDISKAAVRLAAKRCKDTQSSTEKNVFFAVASAFHLPMAHRSVDLLLNCFSPLCIDEFRRVLKTGAYFLYVVPGPMHLWELKSAIYESPYKNEQKETPYDGFAYKEIRHVESMIHLASNEDIQNLFTMTPYFWKTPKSDKDKLLKVDTLDTRIEFDVHVYEKQ